ncbi:MAG: response regulator [Fimbriiglobus sp.]
MRVLCVDDDPDAADSLALFLEFAGFQACSCHNSALAMEAARRFHPDACVLGFTVPEVPGQNLACRLREWAAPRPLPLITLTGFDGDDPREMAATAGFDQHLTRPVDPDQLAAILADMVILRGVRWAANGHTLSAG